jgi:hypothetical protein
MGGNPQQLIGSNADSACTLTSGYRSPARNQAVGGASQSQHMQGKALDVVVKKDPLRFGQLLLAGLCCKNRCVGGLGYYNGNKYHVDNRDRINAWGPGYSSSGIAQITDPGIRGLLYAYLKNGANVQTPDGAVVHAATGQVLSPAGALPQGPIGALVQGTPVGNLMQQFTTTGAGEDGVWATSPSAQYPQGAAATQSPQQIPQQATPYYAPVYSYPPTQLSTQATYQPAVQDQQTSAQLVDTGVGGETTTPDDSEDDSGAKPFLMCKKDEANNTLLMRWSCGRASSKKVHVESRGFNARGVPIGSAQISMPEKTSPYALDCYVSGKKYAHASCFVKITKRLDSFTVTDESDTPKGSLCIFSHCLLSN